MSYKTIPDVDYGLGDRTPACRECTLLRGNKNSRIYATIPGQTIPGPVLQVHIIRYLGISGIEIQLPSTTTQIRTSCVVRCRGKNGQEDGVPKACPQQPASVPNLRVCKLHFQGSGTRRRGRANQDVQPWYRPVGVESTYLKTQGGKVEITRASFVRLSLNSLQSGIITIRSY